LPIIDILVDNAASHALLSMVDCFSGYNLITMHEDDRLKTTFITPWGTFCYTVMPFGLKNAGAPYQRAVRTIFHDMIHLDVDDIIVKSRDREGHTANLRRFFDRLWQFNMRLNPAKCTFGVTAGKLLGVMITQRGIEIDPSKIKAISEMPTPKTEKEIRGFLGRVQYISRFISRLAMVCEPIFKLLKKNFDKKWNDQCQEAFDKIKEYLQNPPVLSAPIPAAPMRLYLTVTETALGAMLAQVHDDDPGERPIYYVSRKLNDEIHCFREVLRQDEDFSLPLFASSFPLGIEPSIGVRGEKGEQTATLPFQLDEKNTKENARFFDKSRRRPIAH